MSSEVKERRVPQIGDDVHIELRLPPSTEEWADELFESCDGTEVERTDLALIARHTVGGNCDGVSNLASWLSQVEDAMDEGDIDLMEFEVKVGVDGHGEEPFKGLRPASKAHLGLVKAVLICLEQGVWPETIRRFVDEALEEAEGASDEQ